MPSNLKGHMKVDIVQEYSAVYPLAGGVIDVQLT